MSDRHFLPARSIVEQNMIAQRRFMIGWTIVLILVISAIGAAYGAAAIERQQHAHIERV